MDESAIGFAAFPVHLFSFCHPLYHKITVFLQITVGLAIEQMFDKIRSGLSDQNILEHMFVLYLYRYLFLIYYIINSICNNFVTFITYP